MRSWIEDLSDVCNILIKTLIGRKEEDYFRKYLTYGQTSFGDDFYVSS